jgi:hypothetical protein
MRRGGDEFIGTAVVVNRANSVKRVAFSYTNRCTLYATRFSLFYNGSAFGTLTSLGYFSLVGAFF